MESVKSKLEEETSGESVKKIKINQPNYKEIKSLKHEKSITCVKFSNKGDFLASGFQTKTKHQAQDKTVKIWHTDDFSLYKTLVGHTDGVCDVSWNFHTSLLCSGSDDYTIRIWSVETVK
jgi:WD40 repeat protein